MFAVKQDPELICDVLIQDRKGTRMLGEKDSNVGDKASGVMRLLAKIPLRLLAIVLTCIFAPLAALAAWRAAVLLYLRYLSRPW